MLFYICCKQEENDCPKKEQCRRYLNADKEVSWTLFKYACTEDNNYHLYMELEKSKDEENKQENKIEENEIKNE